MVGMEIETQKNKSGTSWFPWVGSLIVALSVDKEFTVSPFPSLHLGGNQRTYRETKAHKLWRKIIFNLLFRNN